MVNDLFINTLLLISITFVSGSIFKDIPQRFSNKLITKIILGIGGGLTGILLMMYSIEVSNTFVLLDLRVFAIMMVSYVGGVIPTIVSSIIIVLYRIIHYGISAASVISLFQTLLYIISFYIIDKKIKLEWKKWALKTLASLIILLSAFLYLLRNVDHFLIILFYFSLVIAFAGVLEYFLLEYVRNSNELYRRYKKEATRDFLTDLYNTRHFDKIFNICLERTLENKEMLACFMIDIDHFKKINDNYGHAVGDIILKEVANLLKEGCKNIGSVGRVGGEEFCVLIYNYNKSQSLDFASEIRRIIEKHIFKIDENRAINITVSIGASVYPDTTSDLKEIKQEADMALYKAKEYGRNRVCFNNNI